MKSSTRLRLIGALMDAGCFLIAYLVAGHFGYPSHNSYVIALMVHALLFIVALAVWFALGFFDALHASRTTRLLSSRSLGFARVFLGWIVVIVFLVALLHPHCLDRTELLVFCALMLFMFAAESVLEFTVSSLRLRACSNRCVLKAARGYVASRVSASVGFLLDANTVRGSPCLDRIGHVAA